MASLVSSERIHTFYGVPYQGIWRQVPAYTIPEDALWDAKNVLVRNGVLRPRPGMSDLKSASFSSGTMTGLFPYQTAWGTLKPILGTVAELYTYDTGTTTWTNRTGSGVNLTASTSQLPRRHDAAGRWSVQQRQKLS